jgi:starch synthase
MNLVVNDLDMPLIIKVASIPKREFKCISLITMNILKEKQHLLMKMGLCTLIMMSVLSFFAKGVVETVKKLNWVPDITCSWLDGSGLPIYMKHFYKNEALFSDTKIVTSVYSQSLRVH